ncbi:hypothetical protein NC651_020076 [Populus alba x Populus x berolinensis]|nr:hypothetical protein NC651_020076 [Populus alba x Populus x berolinensis]
MGGRRAMEHRGVQVRDFSGTAIDLWSNDNAITDVLFSAAIVVLLRGQSNIPLGVLNVVMGKAPDIGDASCASPEVRKITFTRSTAVGKKLMAVAAGTVKRIGGECALTSQTGGLDF